MKQNKNFGLLVPPLLIGLVLLSCAAVAAVSPADLRCDYAINPLGVDSPTPRLFWKLTSSARSQAQTGYEILVASSPDQLSRNEGDVWASGRVSSPDSIQVLYQGKQLQSLQQVFWKVRVWDQDGNASKWSAPATWTMGVLNDSDWHARWIGTTNVDLPSLRLRHEFTAKRAVRRALICICGLGQYELSLNGSKIGDDHLSPGWTKYDKTCLYDTYDITASLKRGQNALGIELGNGMYNVLGGGRFTKFKKSFGPQQAIAQIRIEYTDGSVEFVGTDETWQSSAGPITFSSIYGGEDFDGRRVERNWNTSGFDHSKWSPATPLDGPGGKLRGLSCAAPPLKYFDTHKAVASHTLTNGDTVYDLGQNASHVWELAVSGPAGSQVRVMPAELLGPDGGVEQRSMGAGRRGAYVSEFTKGTDGTETWSPKFFFVGCRYLQVHRTAAFTNGPLPRIESVSARVIHSSSEPVGEFECSNELFNRIRKLVRWAPRSNMLSLLTDCPHREKLGWLEQAHLNGPSIRYEFGLDQLFTKKMNDIADSQLSNGLVPTTAPEYTIFADKTNTARLRNNFGDTPEWSAAFILVPWQQYQFSGDLELFRRHFDAMKAYIAYLGTRANHHLLDYGLGDWYDLGPNKPGVSQLTPPAVTASAFYFENVRTLGLAAALIGKKQEAEDYAALAEKIRLAFNEKFYNVTNGSYSTGSQCANALPLVMGICEPQHRQAVLAALVTDIQAHGTANTAGDVGYRYVLRALADGGRSDVIFDINNQTNKPGYGMQLAKGKTSLTEAWDGGSSQNHFMLGQIEEWFYHDVAGIRSDGNGFKRITIAPQPVGDLKWAKASYNSVRGKIVSGWKRDPDKFTLNVTIPANTTATVHLPAASAEGVRENGRPVTGGKGVTFLRMENGRAVYAVGSGSYVFESRL